MSPITSAIINGQIMRITLPNALPDFTFLIQLVTFDRTAALDVGVCDANTANAHNAVVSLTANIISGFSRKN